MSKAAKGPELSSPQVSIIVPNFNHARFLPERFASIRNQTFQDFELIVLDDASSDDSLDVIRAELVDLPHQLIVNKQNSESPCSQWLKGIEQAQGDFIWIAESDDSCTPEFLANMMELMNHGASLAYCRSRAIDNQGQHIDTALYWPDHFDHMQWRSGFTMSNHQFCRCYLVNGNVIPNASAVLFQRQKALACLSIKPLLQGLLFTGDWIFWFHYLASGNGRVSFSERQDSWFRHHAASTRSGSGSPKKESRHIRDYCQAITTISSCVTFKKQVSWLSRAFNPGWDWVYLEYFNRCRPSHRQMLLADGLEGPVADLLLTRLICSSTLRGHFFPGISRRAHAACHWWQSTKARFLHSIRHGSD